MSFTPNSYSLSYKLLSLIPGTVVFLIISSLFLFFFSRYLSRFILISWPRNLEVSIAVAALSVAVTLMVWDFVKLWFDGKGTPPPITPTIKLVIAGPYKVDIANSFGDQSLVNVNVHTPIAFFEAARIHFTDNKLSTKFSATPRVIQISTTEDCPDSDDAD